MARATKIIGVRLEDATTLQELVEQTQAPLVDVFNAIMNAMRRLSGEQREQLVRKHLVRTISRPYVVRNPKGGAK